MDVSFKYLGVTEGNQTARKVSTRKYLQSVRNILRSQLKGKNNQRKKAVGIDVVIPSDSNTKKKECEKLEEYLELTEELEKMESGG